MYKQAVETQDVFLGMGEKDPSSAQCEDMLLRIELPGTTLPAQLEQPIVFIYCAAIGKHKHMQPQSSEMHCTYALTCPFT